MKRLLPAITMAVALIMGACSSGIRPPAGGVGAPAPVAAVERFLQLADENQFLQMGWYFGTSEGSILERDPAPDVEKRMYALATVLQNQGFTVGQGLSVPGRVGGAQQFVVTLRKQNRQVDVPMTVVRGPGERWLVEQVDIQAITGTR